MMHNDALQTWDRALSEMPKAFIGQHAPFRLNGDIYSSRCVGCTNEFSTTVRLLMFGHTDVQLSDVRIETRSLLNAAIDANSIAAIWRAAWDRNDRKEE